MKLHVSTHPWLRHAHVFIDGRDVSAQCRGIDLEERVLYMASRQPDVLDPQGRYEDDDVVTPVGPGTILRLLLSGHEVMPL